MYVSTCTSSALHVHVYNLKVLIINKGRYMSLNKKPSFYKLIFQKAAVK